MSQMFFNGIKNFSIQWVLTPKIILCKFGSPLGLQLSKWELIWEGGFIPLHSPTFTGAWNVILRFHYWLTPSQAFTLIMSPRLRSRWFQITFQLMICPSIFLSLQFSTPLLVLWCTANLLYYFVQGWISITNLSTLFSCSIFFVLCNLLVLKIIKSRSFDFTTSFWLLDWLSINFEGPCLGFKLRTWHSIFLNNF
jgi:hypothetical protein